ncbi:unknown protein [Seminavis robusta]|uniref:Uncharacterized protein n=1 Tax=Seminavis robusta TaxID=568900 RepID=A0A9N8DJ93_9STRA|nr:unknown protein [Seminavis robusta]|eukprot:Sro183_g079541.1  (162) ;mRNA; f:5354-5839
MSPHLDKSIISKESTGRNIMQGCSNKDLCPISRNGNTPSQPITSTNSINIKTLSPADLLKDPISAIKLVDASITTATTEWVEPVDCSSHKGFAIIGQINGPPKFRIFSLFISNEITIMYTGNTIWWGQKSMKSWGIKISQCAIITFPIASMFVQFFQRLVP